MRSGFTLIEFIAVIIIMGVLAAVALPQFLDAEDDARQSATNAIAAALTAASANNYAIRKANVANGSAVTNCTNIGTLPTDLLPSGYTITSLAITADQSITCTVNNPDGSTTATFVGIGVT